MNAADLIFTTALNGTPYNKGVPSALAQLIVAQARHETNNFTSNLFRKYNNAFGYSYYAGSNYQIGPGSVADNGQQIAAYADPAQSTREMVDWLYRRYRQGRFPELETVTGPEQYAAALKDAGYYGDTLANYSAGLRRWFAPIVTVVGVNFIVAAAVLFYIFRKQIL
jgi:hypothetical protein